MRQESPAPALRRSACPRMPGALALSLTGHLCIAFALFELVPSSSRFLASAAKPVEVQLVEDKPLATVELSTAPPSAGNSLAGQTPRARKRPIENAPSVSPDQQPSPEAASPTPSMPQVTTAEDGVPVPRIASNGEHGVAASGRSGTAPSGAKGAEPSHAAAHNPSSGFDQGGPQWEHLRAAIQRRVVYPDLARRNGWQGKVVVGFILQTNGQVRDVSIQSSAGYASLDNSALQAVERAAPLPRAGEPVRIVMPIEFALR